MRLAGILVAFGLLAAPAFAQKTNTTLQPDRLPDMCIAMAQAPDGASISLPCDGSLREKFDLPGKDGGPIMHRGKCLVPKGQGYYPPLFAVACDGSPEQTWTMSEAGELRSGAGRCISVLGASSRTGAMVFAGECPKQGEGQSWRARNTDFSNVVEGSFESKARPGMCIGYDTHFGVFPCTDAFRQVISFDEKALGQFRMMSGCISSGYLFGGLAISDCYDVPGQKWMKMTGDRLTNQNVQCIELRNEDGRDNLRTAKCNESLEQQWTFRPAPANG